MSLKRSHTQRQELFRRRRCRGEGRSAGALRRAQAAGGQQRDRSRPSTSRLSIGAGEPQVSKALLGLAAEGYLEKVEVGKYRAAGMADLGAGRVPEGVRARVAGRFDAAARPLRDRAPQAEQRHDEAAAADGDRRARPLPRRAQEARHRSRARRRSRRASPAPVAPGARGAGAAAGPASPPRRRRERGPAPGPQGLAVPSPASADAPSGPGDTGGHEQLGFRRAESAGGRLPAPGPPCASR